MVIKVGKHEGEFAEETVHETLKCLGTIAEAKWHVEEFKEAEGSGNGGLGDVFRGHFNLVIAFL